MKNLVTVLLVSIFSMTIVNKANATYNSFIKKEYRTKLNNDPDGFKDRMFGGPIGNTDQRYNPQDFLLVPVNVFMKSFRDQVTYYNNAKPYFDQIDDDAMNTIIEEMTARQADAGTYIPMTTWTGSLQTENRLPVAGENLFFFREWPSLMSLVCANITLWKIIPEVDLTQRIAQNAPKQRWNAGGNTNTSSASNVNNINITNNIPAGGGYSTQPAPVYQEQRRGVSPVLTGVIGAVGGYLLRGVIDGNNNNSRYGYGNGGYSNGGNRNPGGGYGNGGTYRGGPYQGSNGNSRRTPTRTIPEERGRNGNVF